MNTIEGSSWFIEGIRHTWVGWGGCAGGRSPSVPRRHHLLLEDMRHLGEKRKRKPKSSCPKMPLRLHLLKTLDGHLQYYLAINVKEAHVNPSTKDKSIGKYDDRCHYVKYQILKRHRLWLLDWTFTDYEGGKVPMVNTQKSVLQLISLLAQKNI